MMEKNKAIDITEEDIREAMKELKTYLDITEEDLKKIYTCPGACKEEIAEKEIREGFYDKGGSVSGRMWR